MEALHIHQKQKTCVENKEDKLKQQGKKTQSSSTSEKKQSTPPIISPASPPSNSSSPSHEFSFTISLHSASTQISDKTKTNNPPSFAIDLTPADDIFFHGHLLPLHLLSHLSVSPRSSTNSLDSFTLPVKELLNDHQTPNKETSICSSTSSSESVSKIGNNGEETRERSKSKSFSLFGLRKWRKGFIFREREDDEDDKKKGRLRFDMSHVIKRYMRMVKPILLFRRRRRENMELHRQAYTSFSGNIAVRNKQDLRGRRGEYSAPASIRTSPTNSGLLVETSSYPSSNNSNDSTMEELQAAIQAAIAHCKNSISKEDKLN